MSPSLQAALEQLNGAIDRLDTAVASREDRAAEKVASLETQASETAARLNDAEQRANLLQKRLADAEALLDAPEKVEPANENMFDRDALVLRVDRAIDKLETVLAS